MPIIRLWGQYLTVWQAAPGASWCNIWCKPTTWCSMPLWGIVLGLVCGVCVWETPGAAPLQTTPDVLMAQGLHALQQGKPQDALAPWQEAARLYAQQHRPGAQSIALRRVAEAYQALGHYTPATQHLHTALALAAQEPAQRIAILTGLSHVSLATGLFQEARQYAEEALTLARTLENGPLVASALHTLGNSLSASVQRQYLQEKPARLPLAPGPRACDQTPSPQEQQAWREVRDLYQQSATVAQQTRQPGLRVRALHHAAMAALRSAQCDEARALLDAAVAVLPSVAPTHDTIYDVITIGLTYDRLRPGEGDVNDTLGLMTAQMFTTAAQQAAQLQDTRARSYALGYLGHLYATAQRFQEALQLTRQAVLAAQQVQAPEALYRWQWQTGRLLHALQDRDGALAAYARAIDTLQSIRTAISRQPGGHEVSFREAIRPLYLEHVDLLLQQAATYERQGQDALPSLREARLTMERLKVSELHDYFRDDCVDEAQPQTVAIDALTSTAVIIYPILLPDRLELLVSLSEKQGAALRRISVAVGAEELAGVAQSFRVALQERYPQLAKEQASKLYTWLIRPLEALLAAAPTQTLVFVPDGVLRTIPLAALYDGTEFLIHKYAVAVTPSLTLTNPQPLPRETLRIMAAGVSMAVAGLPALPRVADELQALQQSYGGTILLNQDFTLPAVARTLRAPFSILHFASHAHFSSTAGQSVLHTFDGTVTLDRFEQLVGTLRFRPQALELLTLSACETALGDERAALGLAGVAIKAGARSALATLWRVDDAAAATLVTTFYRHLQEPGVSRAVALQRAQHALLQHPEYQDPFFWAPFLLLNNWL